MELPAPADAAPADDRGGRSLVLVAAADPSVRVAIAAVLRQAGFGVVEAGDGPAAVAACQARPGEFATALTDIRLPGRGGVELLEAIRRADPGVRCFLMTGGHCDRADLERAGAERVFAKPLDFPAVRQAITAALGRHAARTGVPGTDRAGPPGVSDSPDGGAAPGTGFPGRGLDPEAYPKA